MKVFRTVEFVVRVSTVKRISLIIYLCIARKELRNVIFVGKVLQGREAWHGIDGKNGIHGRNAMYTGRALIKHKLTHTDERPHACEECGKRFKANRSLLQHVCFESHTCDICGKGFRNTR